MAPDRTLSHVLGTLPDDRHVPLGELLSAAGSRAHGMSLLLLSLPEALPLPIPSASAVLGVPLVAISAHLALFGEADALPRRIRSLTLPPRVLRLLRKRVAPLLARAERVSHPRLPLLVKWERILGAVCLYLSVLLLLPLPFFNIPPAICLVLLAWGMVRRDGLSVAAGLAAALLTTAGLAGLLDWAKGLLG